MACTRMTCRLHAGWLYDIWPIGWLVHALEKLKKFLSGEFHKLQTAYLRQCCSGCSSVASPKRAITWYTCRHYKVPIQDVPRGVTYSMRYCIIRV